MISKIDNQNLNPNNRYTYLFQRLNSEQEASIELNAGALGDQLIFPPVQRLTPTHVERKVYTSSGTARASSTGQDGHVKAKHCEAAPDGWHFVAGTGVGIPKPGNFEGGSGGVVGVTASAEQACIEVWAYTGDERVTTRAFEGGFTVTMERSVVDQQQPIQQIKH